jgi:uncharacterized protein YbbC (DUF1343 family)
MRVNSGANPKLLPGIETLLRRHPDWIKGRRVGLVSHLAAVDSQGTLTARRLQQETRAKLVALFGPEHGFLGTAGAGAHCASTRRSPWGCPVHSLYGATRKPTAAMLKNIDVLVFDIQDIATRCYTYVSTLRLVLEAAAENNLPVIVADRPIPLPDAVDGPLTVPAFTSFVGAIPSPVSYAMTPGEAALWMRDKLRLSLHLRVAPIANYTRQPGRDADWPPWMPPSPAILSWESARCFPVTVFFEGIPAVDHGRKTNLPFQIFGAPWIRSEQTAEALNDLRLPGVLFHPHRYDARPRETEPMLLNGVRFTVTEPASFKPIETAVHILATLHTQYGARRLWKTPDARPEFFDKLFGTDAVRLALLDRTPAATIIESWRPALATFRAERRRHLLYPPRPTP